VQIETTRGFQYAVNFHNAQGHMNQIGQQRAFFQHFFQPAYQVNRLFCQLARLQAFNIGDPIKALLRLVPPFPRIDKGLRLRAVF
jgi:hypothetical protein